MLKGKPVIHYKLLVNDGIPAFMRAYSEFYLDRNGENMPEQYLQNFLNITMMQMRNTEALYLCACSGKKVVGFTILNPMPSMDGVRSTLHDGLFVLKDYRNIGIAKMLMALGDGWMRKKGYVHSYGFEKPGVNMWKNKKHFGFNLYMNLMRRDIPGGKENETA